MAGFSFTTKKRVETFLCHCGKKCKPVLVAKNSQTKKDHSPTGMMWECDEGHRERKFTSRDVKLG